jgi:hypothetical protein
MGEKGAKQPQHPKLWILQRNYPPTTNPCALQVLGVRRDFIDLSKDGQTPFAALGAEADRRVAAPGIGTAMSARRR